MLAILIHLDGCESVVPKINSVGETPQLKLAAKSKVIDKKGSTLTRLQFGLHTPP